MCGRITQRSGELPGLVTIEGYGDSRVNDPRDWVRFNGAPSQDFWIIRKHPKTGENQRDRMTWGLIPYWLKDGTGGRKPINAKAETVASLPTFRDAYKYRRCIVPVDNFFEWKAIKGAKVKQPYAIAMKSGDPIALAAIWENWKIPHTEEWMRTFCIITTAANELVRQIHDYACEVRATAWSASVATPGHIHTCADRNARIEVKNIFVVKANASL